MASPDISQQANYQDGNSVFDSVFILEKLDYDFTMNYKFKLLFQN